MKHWVILLSVLVAQAQLCVGVDVGVDVVADVDAVCPLPKTYFKMALDNNNSLFRLYRLLQKMQV